MKIFTNTIIKLKFWQAFIVTIAFCILLSFIFLQPILKNGLTGEDWQLLFEYKTYPEPLNRILYVWKEKGPYTTIQFYYIGILEKLFGLNYQLFQIINIIFKIFASVTLFILISKIFKDNLLASISAIVFSMIHSSAGSLQYVVKGTEYLGLGFMNLFFLSYYYCVAKNSFKLTLYSSLILFITFMLSPIRMFPLFGLIFFIEIYLLKPSIFRVAAFYLPVFFLVLISRGSASGYLNSSLNTINDLMGGNLNALLLPLNGLGYSLLGNEQLNAIGAPAYLVAIAILVYSAICFTFWIRSSRKLDTIFLLFFGPWFALFFLISTWIILGKAFNVMDSMHWYLIVPSLGISIFIAALICLIIDQGVKCKKIYLPFAMIIFISVALVSYFEINRHFNYLLSIGTGAFDQTYIQNQVLASIRSQDQQNLIVFFDLPDDPGLSHYYQVSLNVGHFGHWLFYFKKPPFQGCIVIITERQKITQAFKSDNGGFFEWDGLCAQDSYHIGTIKTRYSIADFRAFLLRDKKIFNMTNQTLENLTSGDF